MPFAVIKQRLHCNGGMMANVIIDMDPVGHSCDTCLVSGKIFPANEDLALYSSGALSLQFRLIDGHIFS